MVSTKIYNPEQFRITREREALANFWRPVVYIPQEAPADERD